MFARIKNNGYDINGNHLYRVYIYTGNKISNQYEILSKEGAKNIKIGRVNKDNSITTHYTKTEILQKLNEKVKISDNPEKVYYVFE